MPDPVFADQVAIVTGAGRGMGREHAKLLARLGARVVVNDIDDSADDVTAEIVSDGGQAVACRADGAEEAQARTLVETARVEFGGLHAVVCNAGVIRKVQFADMTRADLDAVMRANFIGPYNVMRAAWPILLGQRYGRVVLVGSSSAWTSQPASAHYAASKGAVLGLAKSLASEGAGHGVTVNALAPGALTRMSAARFDEATRAERERTLNPALVSPVVAWLLRPDNELNGQIIEAAAGRAALDFVGSTRGYWNEHLTVESLVEHADTELDRAGFGVLTDTEQLAHWVIETTGWATGPSGWPAAG